MDNVPWCAVRDLKNKLMFQDYVEALSDVEGAAELVLSHVTACREQITEQ
jgi:hypothetical protein